MESRSAVQQLLLVPTGYTTHVVHQNKCEPAACISRVSCAFSGPPTHAKIVCNTLCSFYEPNDIHEFKEKIPDSKIEVSKFAERRPKHCVLAGMSGTHSVCVCTIHQNVKLMLLVQEIHIPELPTYHHCLVKIICSLPHPRCY